MRHHHRPTATDPQGKLDVDRLAECIDQIHGAASHVHHVQLTLASAFLQLGCAAILSVTWIVRAWRTHYYYLTPTPDTVYTRDDIRRCVTELSRRGVLSVEGGTSLQTFSMRWRGMH
jgi:hypothetical protein